MINGLEKSFRVPVSVPKAMYARIYPYKGALEMWYQKNA